MVSKRRIRFSIGAMLAVMAVVAVLLNHEAQRAKAIATTVNKIGEWQGHVGFRPRANLPEYLANFLPTYWTQEIDQIWIGYYANEYPELSFSVGKHTLTDPLEFEKVVELGALDNLKRAMLRGGSVNYTAISRICESTSIEHCLITDDALSDDEIECLKKTCPNVKMEVTLHEEIRE